MTLGGPDLLAIAASNGENLKLAQQFVDRASAQDASAELLDLTLLDLPVFTPRTKATDPLACNNWNNSVQQPPLGDLRTGIQRLHPSSAEQCHRLAVGARR